MKGRKGSARDDKGRAATPTAVVPITTDPRAIIASEARFASERLLAEAAETRAQRLELPSPRSSTPKNTTAAVVPITTDPLAMARAILADGHGEFLEARRIQEEWLAYRQPAQSPGEVPREPRPMLADRYPEAAARIWARRDVEAELTGEERDGFREAVDALYAQADRLEASARARRESVRLNAEAREVPAVLEDGAR